MVRITGEHGGFDRYKIEKIYVNKTLELKLIRFFLFFLYN